MHEAAGAPEHVDVLVVGAGLSGIGAGYYLQDRYPGKTYAILEARAAIGGTWDLFRYPGVRSDSDMHTLGYRFRPWTEAEAIADGPSILRYVRETAREYGIDQKVRFNHRVVRAEWSSADARWSVDAELTDTGETVRLTCGFLFACSGYYRYDEGYQPEFEGIERFKGRVVHPQHWSDDVDYAGKRVVVIGSGATAVTLVPAMASQAAHVTMLQRSPSYIVSLPAKDPLANLLRRVLPGKVAYALTRGKNVFLQLGFFQLSRRRPEFVKRLIRRAVARALPAGYEVDAHFKPYYNPWDQRLCLVPDNDLFEAIGRGDASMVTDRVETFTERGLRLESGRELETDVVVTATGLNLLVFGGVEFVVDGDEVEVPKRMTYKSMMLDGVPNFAYALGYTNASWTLKVDLTCDYVCRLLGHMDQHGYSHCVAELRDPSVTPQRLIDFNSGYVLRSIEKFPKQGSKMPWRLHQNYAKDVLMIRFGSIDDGSMTFKRRGRVAAAAAAAAILALGLSACGGSDDKTTPASTPATTAATTSETATTPTETTATETTPTETTSTPAGTTAPGTKLKVGQTAHVLLTKLGAGLDSKTRYAVDATVLKIEKADKNDFKAIDLEPEEKAKTPYYVKVRVKNTGRRLPKDEDPDVRFDGIDDRGQEQGSVTFIGDFPPCNDENPPQPYTKGKSYESCLVYLIPGGGSIDEVHWGATSEYFDKPVVWK